MLERVWTGGGERNIRRWCQSRIGAVVIRRLYAHIIASLSAWHPRRACLIQSTMHMRVNHLPAAYGPVSSISPTPAFVNCQSPLLALALLLQVFPIS